jgi:hypothetical protein
MTAVSHTHTVRCGHAEDRERVSADAVRAPAAEYRGKQVVFLWVRAKYQPMVFPRLPDLLTEIPLRSLQ